MSEPYHTDGRPIRLRWIVLALVVIFAGVYGLGYLFAHAPPNPLDNPTKLP